MGARRPARGVRWRPVRPPRDVAAVEPAGTRRLVPGETLELRAASVGLSLRDGGELGLYDAGTVFGPHDVFFFPATDAGRRYVRAGGTWTVE